MVDPVYRLAKADDVDELVDLRVLMQMEVNGVDVDPGFRSQIRAYFADAIPNGAYVGGVVELDRKLVSVNGTIYYRKPPSMGGEGRVGYVTNVYTRPEWRGQGFATNLMRLLIEHAQASGTEKLHLGTTDSGKLIYERAGFKPVRFAALELKIQAPLPQTPAERGV